MLQGIHRQLRITNPPLQRQRGMCVPRAIGFNFFTPAAGVAKQHPGMATNPAPKKAVPIKVTAAIRLAGAEVIEGAPEICPEELAERISRAMASVRAWK
jgi:hypothetical protein